jgi:ectoine hydroxylase-related dioxygenase (phytanoyl-CoA dioxygenase family)
MGLSEVRFFYDQLFVKEPGTLAPTAWHNDLPFWPLNGNHVASVWVALTDTPKENSGLVYVAGSHKWNKMYYPEPATKRQTFIVDPEVEKFERCPMFHAEFDNSDFRFLSWDLKAGDCLVHHPLAVHGSGKNASPTDRRAAISVRYYGGDVTWHGQRTKFLVPGATDDIFTQGSKPINDEIFPIVWQG